jgi:serine/threonine protein kinase
MLDNGNPRKLLRLMEECGKGGFGSVFLAKHQILKEKVAVKRMPHITEKQRWMNLDEIYFLKNCRDCESIVHYDSAYLYKDEIWVCYTQSLRTHAPTSNKYLIRIESNDVLHGVS